MFDSFNNHDDSLYVQICFKLNTEQEANSLYSFEKDLKINLLIHNDKKDFRKLAILRNLTP